MKNIETNESIPSIPKKFDDPEQILRTLKLLKKHGKKEFYKFINGYHVSGQIFKGAWNNRIERKDINAIISQLDIDYQKIHDKKLQLLRKKINGDFTTFYMLNCGATDPSALIALKIRLNRS